MISSRSKGAAVADAQARRVHGYLGPRRVHIVAHPAATFFASDVGK